MQRCAYNYCAHTKHAGFTLMELMVATAILIVLVTMATSTFGSAAQNSRATSYINNVISSILLARSEASISFQSQVIICPSTSGEVCSNTPWEQGWIVFTDKDLDGMIGENDELLKVVQPLKEGVSLREHGFPSNRIIFDSEGMPNAIGSLILCDERGPQFAKGAIIRATGRPRLATDDDDDGIINTHLGREENAPCPS